MFNKNKLFVFSLLLVMNGHASNIVDEEDKKIPISVFNEIGNNSNTRAVFNFSDYNINNSPLYKGQAPYVNLPMIHPYHPCGSLYFQYFPMIAIDKSKTNFFNIQMVVAPDFEVLENEQIQSFRPHHFLHTRGTETTANPISFTIYHDGNILKGQFNDQYSSHDNVASPNCSHLPSYVCNGETGSILIKYTLNNCNFWTLLMSNFEAFEDKILFWGSENKIDEFNFSQVIEYLEKEIKPNGGEEFYTTLKEAFNIQK